MPVGDYAVGVAFLAATYGAVSTGAWLLVRRRLARLQGAARTVALGLIFTAGLIAVHLLPGTLGVLSRWTVTGVALLWLVTAALTPALRAQPDPEGHPPRLPGSPRWSWGLAGIAWGALAAFIAAATWRATESPTEHIDALTFHLPNIGRWIQSGTFWRVDQFTPLLANGNYPHHGDVVFLSVVLPFSNDALVGLVNPVFVGLSALAAYAIALETGGARSTAALLAAVFTSLPVITLSAYGNAQTDPIPMLSFLAAAVPLLLAEGLAGFAIGMVVVAATSLTIRVAYLVRLFPDFRPVVYTARALAPSAPAVLAVLLARGGGLKRSAGVAVAELALYLSVTAAATIWLERRLLREVIGYLREPAPTVGAAT